MKPRASRSQPYGLYAAARTTKELLRAGFQARAVRLAAADMLTVGQAATLLGIDPLKVLRWSRCSQCIGVVDAKGVLRLPKWQVQPEVWLFIEDLLKGLGTTDSWQLLSFLETPAESLAGLTPRTALEQGLPAGRVLAAAVAHAH